MVWASPTRRWKASSSPARSSNFDSSRRRCVSPRCCAIRRRSVVELALPARAHALRGAEARECGESAQHIGKALLPTVARTHRPEDVLEDAEHHEAEGDADQAVPRHREIGRRGPSPAGRPCRRRARSGTRHTTRVGSRSSPTPPLPCRWRRPPRIHPGSPRGGGGTSRRRIPMRPPTAAPANLSMPFCVLAPTVDRDTTKQVITEV